MLWDIENKEKFVVYRNRDIDLKIKICETNDKDQIYMNYKGYNLTVPMLIWEFQEDLDLASIEDAQVEGESVFNKHFVINKKDREQFIDEIYFFLVDHNMDSVLRDVYRADFL